MIILRYILLWSGDKDVVVFGTDNVIVDSWINVVCSIVITKIYYVTLDYYVISVIETSEIMDIAKIAVNVIIIKEVFQTVNVKVVDGNRITVGNLYEIIGIMLRTY